MTTGIIIIWILVMIMVIAACPKESQYYHPKPKRKKYRRSSSTPLKTLPWFDKDYLKRQKMERDKQFWDDVKNADKFYRDD